MGLIITVGVKFHKYVYIGGVLQLLYCARNIHVAIRDLHVHYVIIVCLPPKKENSTVVH